MARYPSPVVDDAERERAERRAERRAARVIGAVCTAYGITRAALCGLSRDPLLVEARRIAISILCCDLGMLPGPAGRVLHRDHTTIMHHLGRTGSRRPPGATDQEAEMLADIRAALGLHGAQPEAWTPRGKAAS